jgi:hypothetical protein
MCWLLLLASFGATTAAAEVLECRPIKKAICGIEGCKAIPLGTAFSLYEPSGKYARCDARGCDAYEAEVTQSGVFTVIELRGKGTVAKIGPEVGSYRPWLEVTTAMTDAYVSNGYCARRPAGSAPKR